MVSSTFCAIRARPSSTSLASFVSSKAAHHAKPATAITNRRPVAITAAALRLRVERSGAATVSLEKARLLQTHWDEKEASRWSLMTLEVEPGYVAALAVKGHNWELCTWDFEEDGRNDPD